MRCFSRDGINGFVVSASASYSSSSSANVAEAEEAVPEAADEVEMRDISGGGGGGSCDCCEFVIVC